MRWWLIVLCLLLAAPVFAGEAPAKKKQKKAKVEKVEKPKPKPPVRVICYDGSLREPSAFMTTAIMVPSPAAPVWRLTLTDGRTIVTNRVCDVVVPKGY